MQIAAALKEWSVAVDALAAGETILLLRKGGIKENKGKFLAEAENVVLFPTFEHQKPHLLKPDYSSHVVPVESGWHPETITLKAWAQITHIFLTQDIAQVNALNAFHIWQPELVTERLKWKANQPLYILALRAYRFSIPVIINWSESYGGCRSWILLAEGIEGTKDDAAIADADYHAQIETISNILSSKSQS